MCRILTSQGSNRGYVSQRSSPMNGCQTRRAGDYALLVWGLPAAVAQNTEDPCGSEPVREGCVLGDVFLCTYPFLRSRPLTVPPLRRVTFEERESNQSALPLTFGASPRLGIPSLRSCSVGPPRSAIPGRTRLTRHPCRVAHCAEPERSLSRGQEDQKPKQKRGGLTADLTTNECVPPCRSELAREKRRDTAGIQTARVIVDDHREQARSYRREKSRAKRIGIPPRFSPINRPSVSSPAALDLDPPAPSAG